MVNNIAPISPHAIELVPDNKLSVIPAPIPVNPGFTVKSSLVKAAMLNDPQDPNPAAAKSSVNCRLLRSVFPKFSILNSYVTKKQPLSCSIVLTSRLATPNSGAPTTVTGTVQTASLPHSSVVVMVTVFMPISSLPKIS